MRGHGNVVVGSDVQRTVRYAIYTEVNARKESDSSSSTFRFSADFLRLTSQDRSGPRGENMAQEPNSLAFGFAGIVALAVIVLAATTWALHHKTASAVPIPTDAIYQAQHLNLF